MYEQYRVELRIPTLILHNGRLADPLDPATKALKAVTANRKKTDADLEQIAKLEMHGSLYLDTAGRVILPGRLFEAAIAEGAKKTKDGKLALSGLFVDTDALIEYDGGPLSVERLLNSAEHRLTVGVKLQGKRIMRTRPIFKNVRAEFLVSLNPEIANGSALQRWIENTVALVGLGDWRPRYGRGELTAFERAKADLRVAA